METRGTGLTPRRPPSQWERKPVNMTAEPDQGPGKTMAPTSRDASPGGISFTDAMLRNRPSSLYGEQRSVPLAPIPSEVVDVLQDAPGGYCAQIIAGVGSFATEEQSGGGPGNTSESSNNVDLVYGSASRTTGHTVIGKTLGKGTI